MAREPFYVYREFLNKPGFHSTAIIDAGIIKAADDYDEWTDSFLRISDCDRKINLSIDLTKETIDNTLYKLDTLLEGIKGLRKAVAAHKRTLPKG